MTSVIFKYKLEAGDKTIIPLPKEAQILKAGAIGEDIFIWAIVNLKNEEENRTIVAKTTGYSFIEDDEKLNYINSVIMDNKLVFHIFEEIKS